MANQNNEKSQYYQRHPSKDYDRDDRFIDRRFHMAGVEFEAPSSSFPKKPRPDHERHAQGFDDFYHEVDAWDNEVDWHSERFGRGLSRYGDRRSARESIPWSDDPRSESSSENSFRGRGPRGYQRSDQNIQDDVCHLLWEDHQLDASEIEVSVSDGIVFLRGHVESRKDKRRAEFILDGVAGVSDVQNELRLTSSVEGWVPGVADISEEENKRALDAIKGLDL